MVYRIDPHTVTEDPADYTTTWTYDSHGEVLTETLPTGGTHHYERDADGMELELTDDDDRVVRARTYNADGTVATYTDRFGTREYVQGPFGPTHIEDPHGREFDLTYDSFGNVTELEGPGATFTFRYDAAGRRVFADYGRGISVSYEYDANDHWTAIEGPTFGRVERTVSMSGRVTAWTMPNGDTFSRRYDALGRVRESTDEVGNVTIYEFDEAGRLERIEDVERDAEQLFVRDGNGQPLEVTDREGHTTVMTRDVRGALATLTDARDETWTFAEATASSTTTTPGGDTTVTHRGAYGLTTGQDLPGGSSTSVAHVGQTSIDESFRFPLSHEDELGRDRLFEYDAHGGLDTASDLAGEEWAYDYVALVAGDVRFDVESGRVWLEARAAGEDPYMLSSGCEDDECEEMRSFRHALSTVTSPEGDVTTWHRDESGRVDLIEYPHGGDEVRTYDETTGQLSTVTLPHGTTLEYDVDVAGRVLERTGSDSSFQSFEYGPGDRVEEHTDGTGTTEHHYDSAGRYTGLTQPTGASVRFARDRLDRIIAVRVREPGASTDRETEYEYDEAGHIEEIHDPLGGTTTMTYDEDGRLETRTLPNGVVSTWTYDARSRIESIVHETSSSVVLASVTYVRTASGEPTRITREDGTYVEYGYDDALRLERETYYDASDVEVDEITYTYDLDGNRATRTTSAGTEVYHYDPGARLTSITVGGVPIAEYDYDAAGRVTSITRGADERELDWDADDHVVSVTRGDDEVIFDFDAQGRRVRAERKTLGTTTDVHRYATAPTLSEGLESPHLATSESGTPRTGWVFAGEHPLFRYDPDTNERVYYLADAMGSVVGLVGDSPGTHAEIHYDGFGAERSTTGSLATLPTESGGDFRFQGMWNDRDTGLYYVRARSYEVETGRFVSRDPETVRRLRPEATLSYAFASATPTTHRDPTGRLSNAELLASNVAQAVLVNVAVATLNNIRRLQCGAFNQDLWIRDIFWAAGAGLVEGVASTLLKIGGLEGVALSMAEALILGVGGQVLQVVFREHRLPTRREMSIFVFNALMSLGNAYLTDLLLDGDEMGGGELVETLGQMFIQVLSHGAFGPGGLGSSCADVRREAGE